MVFVKGYLKETDSQTKGPLYWILFTPVLIKFFHLRFYPKVPT